MRRGRRGSCVPSIRRSATAPRLPARPQEVRGRGNAWAEANPGDGSQLDPASAEFLPRDDAIKVPALRIPSSSCSPGFRRRTRSRSDVFDRLRDDHFARIPAFPATEDPCGPRPLAASRRRPRIRRCEDRSGPRPRSRANGRLHGLCAADRGGRRSEGREEPVTGGVDLAAPEARSSARTLESCARSRSSMWYRRALPPGP